jgi:Fic family protein
VKPFFTQELPVSGLAFEPLVPLVGRANGSLARFDGILYGIPNPDVLLSPLTTQEAVLSSRIEGTQATLGEVLKFEAGEVPAQEQRRLDIIEIFNYRRALRRAETELIRKPFHLNLLLKLHEILLDGVRGRNKGRGTFRKTQNWIGALRTPIEAADFVPPDPSHMIPALDNWEKYYHAESPDRLMQLAMIHAQFEIIHPFLDGNGRIGRILIPLFLYEKKIISHPMFYLSAYLDARRDEYIARLRAIGREPEGWNRWIAFFLEALDEQARANADKARSIINLYNRLKGRVIALTRSQYAVPLLDQMFRQPVFRSNSLKFADRGPPSRFTIAGLVRKLREEGILKIVRRGRGRRGHTLAFAELINLCEGNKVF